MEARPLQTSITLLLEHVDPELSRADRELYPERIPEHIPFSLTLQYPWVPAAEVTDTDLERLRQFFTSRPQLEFDLTHVSEFPGAVAYAVPEPDEELRAMMRALWAMYPQFPPYGQPGLDPPPHATLGRYEGPTPITFEQARARVEPLLPASCVITEATLQEEYELDRMRIRETFPFTALSGRTARRQQAKSIEGSRLSPRHEPPVRDVAMRVQALGATAKAVLTNG